MEQKIDTMSQTSAGQTAESSVQAPVYPPQPLKQRRVGTFTLGLSLILIGILTILSFIYHEKALMLFKFAPIVLVFLGIEVLIYAVKFKNDKIKYDGLSIFIVIMITLGSLGCSAVVPPMSNLVQNEKAENKLRIKLEDTIEEEIVKNNFIGSVYCYKDNRVDTWYYPIEDIDEKEWRMHSDVNLSNIGVLHPTKEQAADAIMKLMNSLAENIDDSVTQMYITVDTDIPDIDNYQIMLSRSEVNNVSKQLITKKLKAEKL